MLLSAKILLVFVLLAVFVQDLRSRSISVFYLPVLFGLFLLLATEKQPYREALSNWGINLLFIFFHLALLSLYFTVKHRQPVNLTKSLLGWGDILFWLVAAVYFSPVNFMLFFILSLIWSLAGHYALRRFAFYHEAGRVPLAGLQAAFLAGLVLISFMPFSWQPATDDFLLTLMLPF